MSIATNSLYCDDPWYLIHCKSRKELYTANALRNMLKLFVFLPESQVRSRGEVRQVPFFPGYIFAQADLRKVPLSLINTCPGVLRLVEFGGDPQPVPLCVIETLVEQLETVNALSRETFQGFYPGELVRAKRGPLKELEMVFIGPTVPSKRVWVLLQLLGRLNEVQVDMETLERMPAT